MILLETAVSLWSAQLGGGSGNLAGDAVNAALAYRAQAPVLDGLMKELGLDGSSLGALVEGAATGSLSETLEKDSQADAKASEPKQTAGDSATAPRKRTPDPKEGAAENP